MNEDQFFKQLFTNLPHLPKEAYPIGPGDDCAAIALGTDQLLLIAADQLIARRHYLPETPIRHAGRKLLARNLSDIAAMGGTVQSCLVCLGFSPDQMPDELNEFYQGILNEAQQWNVHMIGGDIAQTLHDTVASLTILGQCPADKVVRRVGAKPGDFLMATGKFGNSFETQHHLFFTPRLHEGKWLAEHQFANAMMDVSDGLAIDVARLAGASNCGVSLQLSDIPCRQTTTEHALYDGEDYELIFAVSPSKFSPLLQQWPFETMLTKIGQFTETPGLTDQNGIAISTEKAWDHLKSKE